jgi:hypothetical protein
MEIKKSKKQFRQNKFVLANKDEFVNVIHNAAKYYSYNIDEIADPHYDLDYNLNFNNIRLCEYLKHLNQLLFTTLDFVPKELLPIIIDYVGNYNNIITLRFRSDGRILLLDNNIEVFGYCYLIFTDNKYFFRGNLMLKVLLTIDSLTEHVIPRFIRQRSIEFGMCKHKKKNLRIPSKYRSRRHNFKYNVFRQAYKIMYATIQQNNCIQISNRPVKNFR